MTTALFTTNPKTFPFLVPLGYIVLESPGFIAPMFQVMVVDPFSFRILLVGVGVAPVKVIPFGMRSIRITELRGPSPVFVITILKLELTPGEPV
ncbi:Uncharacterised protein [uncultured archaeon]|nr:Uncharacterised protein [uncultured archaeon]